jgi:hypothetical protein
MTRKASQPGSGGHGSSSTPCLRGLDHRQDAGADRLGQRRPGFGDGGQIGVGVLERCARAVIERLDSDNLVRCNSLWRRGRGLQIRYSPVRIRAAPLTDNPVAESVSAYPPAVGGAARKPRTSRTGTAPGPWEPRHGRAEGPPPPAQVPPLQAQGSGRRADRRPRRVPGPVRLGRGPRELPPRPGRAAGRRPARPPCILVWRPIGRHTGRGTVWPSTLPTSPGCARPVPPLRTGTRPDGTPRPVPTRAATVLRWIVDGVRGPDGATVKLEAVRLPSGWVTTPGRSASS